MTDFEGDFESADVDLFVRADDKRVFEELLFSLGWYKRKEPARHLNHFFYYLPNSEVYLDVKYALSFAHGHNDCFTYAQQDGALAKATLNNKGVCRPTGLDAVLLYAAHLAYKERGKLEEKHRHYLSSYITRYKAECEPTMLPLLEEMESWLNRSFPLQLQELQQLVAPYFRHEKKEMVRSNSRFTKYGYGLNVLFLGTDGAGKTTLIKEVRQQLNLKSSLLYLGMGENGWTTPLFKRFYARRSQNKPLNRVLGLLRTLVILPSEFMLRILPVKMKSKYSVVLIDRFPGFVFSNGNPGRKLLYKTILPKPDLVFFLHADPEVLVSRKPVEITLEGSRANITKFKKVAEVISKGKYVSIDTSKLTISEARDCIISEIYKHSKVYDNLFTLKLD
ncbi:hypothetical protein [Pontibacter akesuensis]|uniref:hypothetical protein n=1 Tax=Pontibacter akesuensis TaxID=388950 RepID=UPI00083A51FC|nr:hypothetical protein [Pontibacter akesuensis]GHA72900.1 hypothetical protein GCM10007389_28430 [Pontibacter akesuensis]